MKAKQLLIVFSIVGIAVWLYFLYKSIPFASSLNLKTIKMILDLTFDMQNIITPVGFIVALVMAVLNQKTLATLGGIISAVMPLYISFARGYFEMEHIILLICSIMVIVVGLFHKKMKLK